MRVYNAAGPKSKSPADIKLLLASSIPKVTVGSITLLPSTGNTDATYWKDDSGTTLNRIGLKNKGVTYYEKILSEIIASTKKTIRVSIAGKTPAEYGELARRLMALGVREIEINASCPNVWSKGVQKTIPSYDRALLKAIIKSINAVSREKVFDYKLSPIANPIELAAIAKLFSSASHVRAIVACNTFPNAFASRIGLAGMGGTALHHIALGQVHQFRKLLPRSIAMVGVGGIKGKAEIQNFKRIGADEIQIGSHYFENGVQVFDF